MIKQTKAWFLLACVLGTVSAYPAWAGEDAERVFLLKDGTQIVGVLIESVDGKYVVLTATETRVAIPMEDVLRFENLQPAESAPDPVASATTDGGTWHTNREAPASRRDEPGKVRVGIDMGTHTGLRLRLPVDNPLVHTVDLPAHFVPVALGDDSYSMQAQFAPSVSFFRGRWHPELGLVAGVQWQSGSDYSAWRLLGLEACIQYDPPSSLELRLGGGVGDAWGLAVWPKATVGWTW